MKKLFFAMLLCLSSVCGVQAQDNALKFDAIIVEYNGEDAKVKEAAEALKPHLEAVAKKFGWVSGRESVVIDQTGYVTFTSGENGSKKTTGQVYAFDQGVDAMILGVDMTINKRSYSFDVTIKMRKDGKGANLVFNTAQVVAAVTNEYPNVESDATMLHVNDVLSQYPDLKLAMSVLADLSAMM